MDPTPAAPRRRLLDDSYAETVRARVLDFTAARSVVNATYRYTPPFLATIASGLDVSLTTIGVALSITELGGLLAPVVGRLVDRLPQRRTLVLSAIIIVLSALVCAAAPNVAVLAAGLFSISLSKAAFDLTVNAWIAEHVPYERRARVIGLVETSWAMGLLAGVPILAVFTALISWRAAFVAGALGIAAVTARLASVLREETGPANPGPRGGEQTAAVVPSPPAIATPLARRYWVPVLPFIGAFACLMGAAQCGFVTFGSWLEDDHGFGSLALGAVTFGLGAVELLASTSTMRLTDRWGKRYAVAGGAALMVPAGLLLAVSGSVLPLGLFALAIYFLGFEFAIVSAISLASNVVPGRAATGIGLVLGAATVGRAVVATVATRLYTAHGITGPLLLGAALATTCAGLVARLVHDNG
ncbi:MAG: MFS transporter [Ilumatobacteraceae bacterium]